MAGVESPVAVETHQKELHGIGREPRQGVIGGEGVEVVHDPGQVQVAEGVEALQEGLPLVLQVALDREIDPETGIQFPRLGRPAELRAERILR